MSVALASVDATVDRLNNPRFQCASFCSAYRYGADMLALNCCGSCSRRMLRPANFDTRLADQSALCQEPAAHLPDSWITPWPPGRHRDNDGSRDLQLQTRPVTSTWLPADPPDASAVPLRRWTRLPSPPAAIGAADRPGCSRLSRRGQHLWFRARRRCTSPRALLATSPHRDVPISYASG